MTRKFINSKPNFVRRIFIEQRTFIFFLGGGDISLISDAQQEKSIATITWRLFCWKIRRDFSGQGTGRKKKEKKPVHKGPGCDVGGWKPLKLPLTALFIDCQRPSERKSTQDTTWTRPKYWPSPTLHGTLAAFQSKLIRHSVGFRSNLPAMARSNAGHSVCQLFILENRPANDWANVSNHSDMR